MTEPIEQGPGTREGEVRKQRLFRYGIALLILGTAIFILGTAWGMAESFIKIETEKAPTPDELAVGVYHALFAQRLGSVTSLIGLALLAFLALRLLVLRFLRLRRRFT